MFESPEITDTEGDGIIIELQEEVEGIEIVPSDTTFILQYDQGLLTLPPASLKVILKNEQTLFPNSYYFNLLVEIINTDVILEVISEEIILEEEIIEEEIIEEEEEEEEEEEVITKTEPTVGPSLPPWLKLIDPEEMKALEDAQNAMILEKQQEAEAAGKVPVPVKIVVEEFTADG